MHGTRWRTGGEVKGKLANGVGSQCLYTTLDHGVSSITTADAHTSAASSRLNWRPRRFKWTRPFRRKTKSGFCACAITFQLASTTFQVRLKKQICVCLKMCHIQFMMDKKLVNTRISFVIPNFNNHYMYLHSVVRRHDSSFVVIVLLSGAEGVSLYVLTTCIAVVCQSCPTVFLRHKRLCKKRLE